MEQERKRRIEEIIGGMECPKDFECRDAEFASVCRAKDIGMESFLECLEENLRTCKFALPFGAAFSCQCPLRVYIAKKFKK